MLRIVLLSALAALAAAQQYRGDPRTAAIINEDRYLKTNGQFGAAYKQEDGVQFKEESDADGTRRGSYSYVDPSGTRRTVNYVAGKNGFQPVGDHIPSAPAPVVNPQPQYNPPPQQQPQAQYNPPAQYGSQPEDDGQWVDDTRQEYPSNSVSSQWNSPAPQSSWNSNPAPQPSWNSNPAPQPSWNSNPAPQPSWNSNTGPQTFNPPAQQWTTPAPAYNQPEPQRWSAPLETTPSPHRFLPPGKLSLNRSPDGFSFSFNKS